MASPSERPPMRVVPLEKKPSRTRLLVLGVVWLLAGTTALAYMARRPSHLGESDVTAHVR